MLYRRRRRNTDYRHATQVHFKYLFHKRKKIFSQQRFFKEKPKHRFYMIDDADNIVAHVAVHEKQVTVENKDYSIAGIAEVCVLPTHRKQGLVNKILSRIHQQLTDNKTDFSILFGDHCIYNSSGYQDVANLTMYFDGQWKTVKAMARSINTEWPTEEVRLTGLPF
ncbi:GNAT family N-acetyltransferase [Vibrio algarum]|uniref:GNAT family N-acetyltransferase n=1 Tax=Vibrio algarum TaxID=3020714 RepID=A0ABT4YPV4_9VIBR|nr:GNAT family N-acetyltransferase [Vibrio sp. KJ40-1]MDB1123592.1 GNAT family N-acetyltransferase [Vibrio sp. KJ40-1]